MPWSRNLGGPRVSVELADEFRKRGCSVEKYDICDAFPNNNKFSALFGVALFHKRAAKFVKQHRHEFDVIQAEQGNLPYSKSSLRFGGLLIAHSSGLAHLHEKVLRRLEAGEAPFINFQQLKSKVLRHFAAHISGGLKAVERSFEFADKVILKNQDELAFAVQRLGCGKKASVLPNGISDERLRALAESAFCSAERLAQQRVVFIGRWHMLKGCADFPGIVRRIRAVLPNAKIVLLGTGMPEREIKSFFEHEDRESIHVVSAFFSEELPSLLAGCTVGVFPSYTEGFGIGVLEKLASGVPCVSYDIPGPREMLSKIDVPLMVPVGDQARMADTVLSIMQMSPGTYSRLSATCRRVAEMFRWADIAERALRLYLDGLTELSIGRSR